MLRALAEVPIQRGGRVRLLSAAREKWNSERGASILMALLFLLLSMLVGASVVMAAASNGGKIRSNQAEQQRYLALSSALRLVCDELESIEYVGRYRYCKAVIMREETIGSEEDGTLDTIRVFDHMAHYYWQQEGELRKKGGTIPLSWNLKNEIPFHNDLDKFFSDTFPVDHMVGNDEYKCTQREGNKCSPRSTHIFTVTPDVSSDEYGVLAEEITVTLDVNRNSGDISLKATFTQDPTYVMHARMKAGSTPQEVIRLGGDPADGPSYDNSYLSAPALTEDQGKLYETDPLTWTLQYISKAGNKEPEVSGP